MTDNATTGSKKRRPALSPMTDNATTGSKKRRPALSPGERQQERYDAANTRLKRAIEAQRKTGKAFVEVGRAKTEAEAEVKAAEAALEYESNHPDLPKNTKADAGSAS